MITGGQLCAYAVSAGLENVNHGWRILFALSLPFALGQGIAMHWLPETPRFAVLSGNVEGARKTLGRIYPKASEEQIDMKLKVIELATEVSVSLKKKHPSIAGRMYAVCTTPQYLRCTVCAAVVFLGKLNSDPSLSLALPLFGALSFLPASGTAS